MSAAIVDSVVSQVVKLLVAEAKKNERCDRRVEPRYPFFVPVSLQLNDGPKTRLSAFSREISRSGIGLLHKMEVKPGPVSLSLTYGGTGLNINAQIIWCRPAGDGWFLSGGRFVSSSSAEPCNPPPAPKVELPDTFALKIPGKPTRQAKIVGSWKQDQVVVPTGNA